MAIQMTDDCNGCEICTGCGRCRSRHGVFCDICKQEIGETVYFVDGLEVCDDCLPDVISHQKARDYLESVGCEA